jgi:hypothetical protein
VNATAVADKHERIVMESFMVCVVSVYENEILSCGTVVCIYCSLFVWIDGFDEEPIYHPDGSGRSFHCVPRDEKGTSTTMESAFSYLTKLYRIGIHMTSASFFFISVSALLYTISWQKSFECSTISEIIQRSTALISFSQTNYKTNRNEFQST